MGAMGTTTETNQLETTLNDVREAFAEGASREVAAKGIGALEALLASLRGAQENVSSVEGGSVEQPSVVSTPKPVLPGLLDGVLGLLKAQLTAEDLAVVEQEGAEGAFSVPFIDV